MRFEQIRRTSLYEMSNLPARATGLSFWVYVSPKGGAKHDARVKTTLMPPWKSHPIASYSLRPVVEFVDGMRWMSASQERDLAVWVDLNLDLLLDYWRTETMDDAELQSRQRSIKDAPKANVDAALIALRASAPKVQCILWFERRYVLVFDTFAPRLATVQKRFRDFGFDDPVEVRTSPIHNGSVLWSR